MVDFTKKTEKIMSHSSIDFKSKTLVQNEKATKAAEIFNRNILNKKSIFDNSNNPVINNVITYIENNYNEIYDQNKSLLLNMAKRFSSPSCNLIDTWGEDVLTEQKEIVEASARRIAEFNNLQVNKLLGDVIDNCSHKKGIVTKFFKQTPSVDEYTLKITALKTHLEGLSESIDEYIKKCKSSKLAMYLSVLSAYAETNKSLNDDLDQSIFNRRRLLQQALQNIQIASSQLEQIKNLISNAKNEASHILNVTLPSLSLIDINK